MNERKWSGYTPSGNLTTSVRTYLREWNALTKPFEKTFGVKRCAFDPHVIFVDPKTKANIDLPVWFIKRANKIADGSAGKRVKP